MICKHVFCYYAKYWLILNPWRKLNRFCLAKTKATSKKPNICCHGKSCTIAIEAAILLKPLSGSFSFRQPFSGLCYRDWEYMPEVYANISVFVILMNVPARTSLSIVIRFLRRSVLARALSLTFPQLMGFSSKGRKPNVHARLEY